MAANWPSFSQTMGEPVVFTAAGSSASVTVTALVSFPKSDEQDADTREMLRQTALVSIDVASVETVTVDDLLEFHGATWLVMAVDKGEGAVWRCSVERRETLRVVGRGRTRI